MSSRAVHSVSSCDNRAVTIPFPTATRRQGALLLADISGYTGFLQGVAEAHRALIVDSDQPPYAYAVMSSTLQAIIEALSPRFQLAKLEGDAVFAVADDGTIDGESVLATLRDCYTTFRAQLAIAADTCTPFAEEPRRRAGRPRALRAVHRRRDGRAGHRNGRHVRRRGGLRREPADGRPYPGACAGSLTGRAIARRRRPGAALVSSGALRRPSAGRRSSPAPAGGPSRSGGHGRP